MRVKLIFTFFYLIFTLLAKANGDSTTVKVKKVKNTKLLVIPVVYYAPETKWGVGAAGVFRFKSKNEPDSMRHSNVMFAFSATQLGQIVLGTPFQFWFKKEKYNIYGEPAYQKVNYLFFGTGNNISRNFREKYYTDFFRLRLAALQKIRPSLYAGIRYVFDYTTIYNLSDTGMLIKGNIAGSSGGFVSGIGGTIKYDNRDNQFYATKGYYLELFGLTNSNFTGSSYRFDKYSLDMTTYFSLPYKQVIAVNAYGIITTGNVPFYHLAMLGGDSKLRGIYQGRYRDKDSWIIQAEYRAKLFWKFGAVIFAGAGGVANRVDNFNLKYTQFTYGAGIRGMIDKKQHLNMRFDVGVNNNHLNYYFTIGEAF